jgi:predicted dehydrogenase
MSQAERPPLKVGLLGVGAVSQLVYLPILSERVDVDLTAVADTDRPKAETLAGRFEVPRVLTDQEILSDDDVEAVMICTPTYLHEAAAVSALEGGKHVLVEQPVALSSDGVRRVLDAASAAGRHVAVGMNHRFRPDVGALSAFVTGGELGDIYAVRTSSLSRKTPSAPTWRQRPEEAGGGALMDLGVQIVDLSLWLVGYPKITRVSAVLQQGDDEVEEAASLFATSDSGVAFSVEVSWSLFAEQDRHYARVMGTEGSGLLPPLEVHKQLGGRPINVTPRQPRPRGGENRFTNSYRRLLDQFLRTVADETDQPPPTEQIMLMDVIAAAYRSAREGREISLE